MRKSEESRSDETEKPKVLRCTHAKKEESRSGKTEKPKE